MSYEQVNFGIKGFSTPIPVHCTHQSPKIVDLSCQLFQRKHKQVRKSVFGHCYWFFTLCASGHKTQNLQMLFRDQDRVRVGFTRCGFDKVLKMFSFVTNLLIGQHFSELCHHKNCTHDEKNGTVNMEQTAIP